MLKIFKNEISKTFTIGKIIFYLIALVIIISVTGIIIKTKVLDISTSNSYIEYLKYNLTFVLIKPLIPILMIILSASTIADDYSSGVMKFFLISRFNKVSIIIDKIIYLITFTLVNMVIVFLLVSIIGGALIGNYDGLLSLEYFTVMGAYITTAIGMLPIVLLTVSISLILDNFQQSIGVSIGLLIVSLMADSIMTGIKGITPTSFISYGYMFVLDINYKLLSIILLFSYIVILVTSNILLFNKKDILL